MTEDSFTLELRALVKKYYPDNLGHEIKVDLPHDSNYRYYSAKVPE